jgi:hypothetical protein
MTPRRALVAMTTVAALALAGCGSTASSSSAPSSHATPASASASAGGPSAQTRMICATEAQHDLAATLGLQAANVSTPTWRADVYSCAYRYANGSFTLSVHQAADTRAAHSTFTALGAQLTRRTALEGLGDDAVTTANGSVLVQKDDDVLLVDIRALASRFGVPPDTRANAAISIAATIMGCWTGS